MRLDRVSALAWCVLLAGAFSTVACDDEGGADSCDGYATEAKALLEPYAACGEGDSCVFVMWGSCAFFGMDWPYGYPAANSASDLAALEAQLTALDDACSSCVGSGPVLFPPPSDGETPICVLPEGYCGSTTGDTD
jgi:hypothetical protein